MHITQVLANGIMLGSIYGLLAVSLALIFGVLEIPQFAMGSVGVVGAYVAYLIQPVAGTPAALLLAMLAAGLLGCMVHALVFEPLRDRSLTDHFLVAFATLLVLEGLLLLGFGPNNKHLKPAIEGSSYIFGASITHHRIFVVVAVLVAALALDIALRKTLWGKQVRAVSQSVLGSTVVGISARRIAYSTTLVASALAGLAAASLAPISQIYPTMGDMLVVKAFIIIVLAGMGSIRGALLSGYIVGLVESLGAAYIAVDWQDLYLLMIFFVVLVIKPEGIFGRVVRKA